MKSILKFLNKNITIVLLIVVIILAIIINTIYKKPEVKEFLFDRSIKYDLVVKAPMGNINVELANTNASREIGLSYRTSMNQDEGMLFVFDKIGKYGFWMKDMNFPLDILWLDEEGRVIYEDRKSVELGRVLFRSESRRRYAFCL